MFTIALEGVQFYAYHGFYAEEQVLGCYFIVDVQVSFEEQQYRSDDLDSSVNYELIYQLLKKRMLDKPYMLLEDLVQDIVNDVTAKFSFAKNIKVKVVKQQPPLGGSVAASVVSLERKY